MKLLAEIGVPDFVVKAKKDVHTELKRGVELGMPEKEFKRLTEKMFPKWVNDDSKIAMFMKELDLLRIFRSRYFVISSYQK